MQVLLGIVCVLLVASAVCVPDVEVKDTPYVDTDGVMWYTETSGSFTLTIGEGDSARALVCPGVGSTRIQCTLAPARGEDGIDFSVDIWAYLAQMTGDASTHTHSAFDDDLYGSVMEMEFFDELDFTFTLYDGMECITAYAESDNAGDAYSCTYGEAEPVPPAQPAITSYASSDADTTYLWYNQEAGSMTVLLDDAGAGGVFLCPGQGDVRVVAEITRDDNRGTGLMLMEAITDAAYTSSLDLAEEVTVLSLLGCFVEDSVDAGYTLDSDSHCVVLWAESDDSSTVVSVRYSVPTTDGEGEGEGEKEDTLWGIPLPYPLPVMLALLGGVLLVVVGVVLAVVCVAKRKGERHTPLEVLETVDAVPQPSVVGMAPIMALPAPM
ncbi:hypothetical protein KIPB_006405 [Kipferlia bialata]|uniref:Ig-like domain-containing protein n=1 Tax=Kipferlia bialata TaxID=797122 RepID=A0A9K3CWZ6_9EUKA|nr:hypothetical protein KIPB_006405 [Kipferlia bialata]|eukprot:g6405.t1